MFLTYCAYGALIICLAGTGYRAGRWLTLQLGQEAQSVSGPGRLGRLVQAMGGTLLRPVQLLRLLRGGIVEVFLQGHILRQSPLRWTMHMMLCYGMVLLLLMHVFDDWFTARLFSDYASTLNPYLFLRNAFGIFLLLGVIIAWVRRRRMQKSVKITRAGDRWVLVLLAGLVLSGVALEAVQIISPAMFDMMVADYMGSDDPEEVGPLKAFWAARFDVAFTPMPSTTNPEVMAMGRGLHEDFCAACHSRPLSAVLSYPVALTVKPWSDTIGRLDLETWLWYAHYLLSCLALALLPFSKLFHLVATPISLAVRSLGTAGDLSPPLRPTRRALGLDACTHCGVCTEHCAVAPIRRVIVNSDILPSEKIGSVAAMAAGRARPEALARLSEGSFICTACGRCTRYCPSGIDLQDMWEASRGDLLRCGQVRPHNRMQNCTAGQGADMLQKMPDATAARYPMRQPIVRLADKPDSFQACVQCSICTSVCPVVAMADNPSQALEVTPQQVMNLLRLQQKESAMASRMVWDCVTCYKCQEHCPQGVRVADILYELRNEACRRLFISS